MTLTEKQVNGSPVPSIEAIDIRSGGNILKGNLYKPADTSKAAIVLHGATGVPQRFYRHFASWLASEGYTCLTYDYRDFGASANGHPKTSRATMSDWGIDDQSAAQRALEELCPNAPLWVIGHSLGGFMLPFQKDADRINRLIAVASGPVHLSDTVWRDWLQIAFFWSRPVLLLARSLGYLPGRLFGINANLPLGVFTEWRRWCTTKGFYLCDVGKGLPVPDWSRMQGDAKFVAIADDGWIPPPVVWRLMQHYPEAKKRQLTLRPSDYNLQKVGHIGAFAEKNRALWPAILE